MDDTQQRFGSLRSLLAGPPASWRWSYLCGLLGSWPDPHALEHEVLPYTAHHLRDWPDTLRLAPERWTRLAAFGRPVPQLRLARVLHLSEHVWTGAQLRRLATSPSLGSLHTLSLALTLEDDVAEGITTLLCSPACAQLRDLAFEAPEYVDPVDLNRLPTLSRLETLTIYGWGYPRASWLGALVARCPALRVLELVHVHMDEEDTAQLAACDLSHLHTLRWSCHNTLIDPLLAASMPALRHLHINTGASWPASLDRLPEASWLGALETLEIDVHARGHEARLAVIRMLRDTLHTLVICAVPGAMDALISCIGDRLEHLEVQGQDSGVLCHIAASIPTLRTLKLDGPCPPDASLEPLRDHPALDTLALNMSGCDAARLLGALCGGATTARARSLTLSGRSLDAHAAAALARTPMPALTELVLRETSLGDAGLEALAGARWFTQLHALSLCDAGITHNGLSGWLARPMKHLHTLDLAENPIDDTGAQRLASAPALANITSLSLNHTGVLRSGFVALFESPTLPCLELLSVRGDRLRREDLLGVQHSPPREGLRWLNLRAGKVGARTLTRVSTAHEGSWWLEGFVCHTGATTVEPI